MVMEQLTATERVNTRNQPLQKCRCRWRIDAHMQRCNGLPVPEADTIVDVGAVVIKLRHAAVTDPGKITDNIDIYVDTICRY